MHRALSLVKNLYLYTLIVLNYISVVLIFLMALWVFGDIVGRYLFNHPIPGTTELVQNAIITIVFLGIAYTLRKGRHIRAELIKGSLPPVPRTWCEIVACLIGIITFALLCIFAFQAAWTSWLAREFDGVQIRIPVYPSRVVVAIGSALLVIQSILDLLTHLRTLIKHYRGETA